MEQTTEGTISYLLSISWSHFSPTSAKPSSLLVEVMVIEVEGGQSLMKEEDRPEEDLYGFLDQQASPMEMHLPANKRKRLMKRTAAR